jgi:hypothetical protein
MSRYQNASIYKIVCNDPDVKECYIGSTCNLYKRKSEHKSSCNNEKNKNYNLRVYQCIRANGGWNNWSVIQIEAYSCNYKRELELRERYHLEELKANLNCHIPTRSYQEWQEDNKEKIKEKRKEQYEKNKEYYKEKSKQYKANHKEAVLEYRKLYNEKNKQVIKETRSKLIECECGAVIGTHNKHLHARSKKHLYYERISEFINS